ncbi:MAG: hypothetical protein JSU08_08135 [Acidobacteria bacterium]|nr:hypothetical protein [Acidobacteriota bacterium]
MRRIIGAGYDNGITAAGWRNAKMQKRKNAKCEMQEAEMYGRGADQQSAFCNQQ